MLARVSSAGVELREVHRFDNEPVHLWQNNLAGLHWDLPRLFQEVLLGLRAVSGHLSDGESVASIGIDSWAVDYGLLDGDGSLLGTPYCYRDARTTQARHGRPAGVDRVHAIVAAPELYQRNGLQFLPFNTLYQLAAEDDARLSIASRMLLVPDLIAYWLTGAARTEVTNASTTGLLDVRTQAWDLELTARLGLEGSLLAPLIEPGQTIGTLLPHVAEVTGLSPSTPVIAVNLSSPGPIPSPRPPGRPLA